MNFTKKLFICCMFILPTLGLLGSQAAPTKNSRAAITSDTASYVASGSASGVGSYAIAAAVAAATSSSSNETTSAGSSTSATSTTRAAQDQEQKKETELKSEATTDDPIEALKQRILKGYNPTAETSRPSIRAANNAKGYENARSLLDGEALEPTLACILAGHKDVGTVDLTKKNPHISSEMQELCEAEHITILPSPSNPFYPILYKPQGKTRALLLYKFYHRSIPKLQKMGIYCPYSYGYLYGYSEQDIKACYHYLLDHPDHARGASFKITEKSFEADKKAVRAWAEKNTSTIEKWVNSHPLPLFIQMKFDEILEPLDE